MREFPRVAADTVQRQSARNSPKPFAAFRERVFIRRD